MKYLLFMAVQFSASAMGSYRSGNPFSIAFTALIGCLFLVVGYFVITGQIKDKQ